MFFEIIVAVIAVMGVSFLVVIAIAITFSLLDLILDIIDSWK